MCYRKGWLHAEKHETNFKLDVVYFFASPLHRWFVQAWLGISNTAPPIQEDNLLSFVINIIHLFSPMNLSTLRNISPRHVQRPPEAQFQDEFYRSCNTHTGGSVLFPEFGTSAGWIDFFVPSKKWGIELLTEGLELRGHSSRFSTSGTYAHWVDTDDYIILDFRTKAVRSCHPSEFLGSNMLR